MSRGSPVGSISALWRYPVKSMMGEEIESSHISEAGFLGDRSYALIDPEDGKVVSAKNPKKWGAIFQCKARFEEPAIPGEPIPPVTITLPDGGTITSDAANANEVISNALGRKVQVASVAPKKAMIEEWWPDDKGPRPYGNVTDSGEGWKLTDFDANFAGPAGGFFDFSAVHLISTATLNRLQKEYPEGRFDARRFRPNLVVETPAFEDFVENDWSTAEIGIGGDVRLKGILPTIRCVMTTLEQEDLPKDAGILRTIAQHNRLEVYGPKNELPCAGIFLEVLEGGAIRLGDPVSLI